MRLHISEVHKINMDHDKKPRDETDYDVFAVDVGIETMKEKISCAFAITHQELISLS